MTRNGNTEDGFDTLVRRVLELARTQPDHPALIFRKEALSYGACAERIRRAALELKALGVKRGDRVLYTAVSRPESFVLLLAIQYLGATAVPTDKAGLPEAELALYENAKAALLITALKLGAVPEGFHVITEKAFFARLEESAGHAPTCCEAAGCEAAGAKSCAGDSEAAAADCTLPEYELPEREEIAEILFTSGTTGKPKGVMLSFRAVYHITLNSMRGIGLKPEDRVLIPLPLHHSLALRMSRATLYAGGTLVLQNGFAFAKETENNLLSHACTGFVAVPVSMELLRGQMKERFYEVMGAFRFIEIGAGALTVEQRKRLDAKLPNTQITNTWGSSETGGVIFTYVHEVAGDARRVGTLGRVIDSAKLSFIPLASPGHDGEKSTDGGAEDGLTGRSEAHPGRLALGGGMVMSGYWENEEETRDALRGSTLVTNDLAWADEEGYVYMLGRSDDIINIGGEKLSPLEMENAASEYEDAGEYACIGVPDPKGILGQVPVLFVGGCRENYSAAALREYLASKMTRLKLPVRIIELDSLPRNRMQKLNRKALHEIYKTL